MCDHLDNHGKAFYMFTCASRWLGVRIDVLASTLVVVIVFVGIAVRASVEPSLVALSIVFCLQLLQSVQWTIRQVCYDA